MEILYQILSKFVTSLAHQKENVNCFDTNFIIQGFEVVSDLKDHNFRMLYQLLHWYGCNHFLKTLVREKGLWVGFLLQTRDKYREETPDVDFFNILDGPLDCQTCAMTLGAIVIFANEANFAG